jgi:hypothetical protein
VGLGVPARVCQDELSGAAFFRVAKVEGPHDDPPAKGALGTGSPAIRLPATLQNQPAEWRYGEIE